MDIPYTVAVRRDTGLTNGKIGIWLFLASEVMLVGALFASYLLIRTRAPAVRRDTGLPTGRTGICLFRAAGVMLCGALFGSYILIRTGAPSWPRGDMF